MNWFRAHRRHIVAIAALAVIALALVRYVCPWPLGEFDVSPLATQSSTSAMSSDHCCGPADCTYTRTVGAAPDKMLLTNPPAPLSVAVFFSVIGAFALVRLGTQRARTFHWLPGYPPILEFYRLRI